MKRLMKFFQKCRNMALITWYVWFYYRLVIKENCVLVDSKNGKDLGSNLLRITEELTGNGMYKDYKIYLACNKDSKQLFHEMIEKYGLRGARIVRHNGFRYWRIMSMAKFLFTDTTFPANYIKKEGQVVVNTWHGTPLKMMGRDVENRAFDMGNVQKNHLIADYLLYPSDYMKDIMVKSYCLDNLYQGKILCSGYPRNSVFFDRDREVFLRKELNLENKRIYTYMPTWRGTLRNIDHQKITAQLEYFMIYLDRNLTDDEIFYVRLHPFVSNTIDYSLYKHIKPFPAGYEPYDILNICDCMVTDYSSVLFDFANSRKKIVLFVYDRELYIDERGLYVSMDSFPFPQVRSVKRLLQEMRLPKEYDDTEFCRKFCQYDGENVAEKLCRHIVKGEHVFQELDTKKNSKENVLIYSGSLGKNGLTTALLNLLANIDTDKRNYFITFRSASLKSDPLRVTMIPENIGIIPIASMKGTTLAERKAINKYFEKNENKPSVSAKIDRFFKRLYQRNFGHCKFDDVIHYAGYEKNVIHMFLHAPARRMIFVHNDMIEEIGSKGNQHELTLRRAYKEYDRVVPVTNDIYPSTLELGGNKENIHVASNVHDYKSVLLKAQRDVTFDADTVCNVLLNELDDILSSNARKFITIGRFSNEKGHEMLIKAFDKYYKNNPDSYLIIIGGYGPLYSQTLGFAGSRKSSKHIVIIKSISNPMAILKQCDLFILPSLYEGLGLVLLEADTLGIPVISTDIVGPRGFMTEHGGYMVEPTVEGLYNGMLDFDAGKVKAMHVDYEKHNQDAVVQFEQLFEGEA